MANENYEADRQEAQKRFEALPENLKKEMLADKNVQLIADVCRDYGIPESKVKEVALLTGEVFLGYLKPEEIASELHEFFGFDLQKSNFIEIELKQKLFNPLKADLEKVYNPPKPPEEVPAEEAAPAIIKTEVAPAPAPIPAAPTMPILEKQPEQSRVSPLTIGSMPIRTEAAPAPKPTTMPQPAIQPAKQAEPQPATEMPFVIHTKTEAVKPIMPQFSKETPSLNLKVEPSIIQKPIVPKPVAVRLEVEQKPNEVKFGMPVSPKQATETTPTLKQITEQKTTPIPAPAAPAQPAKEEAKVVHYSNFKTPLTPGGLPQKPETKKGDMINLSTFTKVSGNTVDLRNQK